MKSQFRGRGRLLTLVTAVVAAVTTVLSLSLTAGPATASAGPGNSGWQAVSLPGPVVPGVPSLASCTSGTSFCLTVSQLNNLGYTVSVTADAGASWQHYATLSAAMSYPNAASCPTTTVCWLAGYSPAPAYGPGVAETTDGGKTWTDMTPANLPFSWQLTSIDCVSATTCWIAGDDSPGVAPGFTPVLGETTDGGANWTWFTNLPAITQYDPQGTYALDAIACTSALDCVAGGGLDVGDGLAQVIFTTDGGETWSRSTDPTLTGLQEIFGLSCVNGSGGLPTCYAAAAATSAAGPVVISSTDGGATWSGMETYDNTGWMYSIACPDAAHCRATGAGTTVGLVGTADGGNSWTVATSDTSNEEGSVACASVSFCVTTTDNALWETTTGGGGSGASKAAAGTRLSGVAAAVKLAARWLPEVSGPTVAALAGRTATVTGQYRALHTGTARVTFTLPTGTVKTGSASIGLNGYYTVTVAGTPKGVTKVQVSIAGKVYQTVVVHGYPAPAPAVTSMSVHAGPAGGGTAVTIKGTNFRHVSGVYFGSALVRTVAVSSPTELTVKAPAGKQASYLTVVTRDGGPSPLTGRSVFNFLAKPALGKLSPASGPAGGGTTVTITGSGFAFVKKVYFGTKLAAHFKVVSSREMKVSAPPGTGTVQVRVVTAGGTTPVTAGGSFSY
ncbi:hypothetical protein EAS64_23460 [Trebonia kvetii]|uniref:IPT/TIG domain-containing protein n=1 Tax=Trebonia kvetii TaxID=2480626 RepID=A0A6P2BYU7_9ACTN|nr:IPT/TIG domain-containing protein [Trebonia kvetii]TVZ03365.1 hypothetical protein EAS64_23460 [Trebonia kvetii]